MMQPTDLRKLNHAASVRHYTLFVIDIATRGVHVAGGVGRSAGQAAWAQFALARKGQKSFVPTLRTPQARESVNEQPTL
jgi:hypothetical protein